MVIEKENLEQAPQVSDERIAGVVMKVLEKVKEDGKERSHLEGINRDLGFLKKVICDESGQCRLVTKEEFTKTKEQDKDERKKKDTLPHMTTQVRRNMSEGDQDRRDVKFAEKMQEIRGTLTDAFRWVFNDAESRPALKRRVLAILEPDDVKKYLTEQCFVGANGKLVCEGLTESGYRVQRKDGKDWKTLGLSEEQEKKKVLHF